MRTVVFINSHSRQAAPNVKAVKRFFSKQRGSFDIVDYIVVEELDDFEACLKRLVATKNLECVIVCSGDGTIVAILNALKKREDIVYGFVPLGTSNTFVRSLGLPLDFKQTLEILTAGHIRSTSLGSINGRLFANIADIGVPAQVADKVTDKVKKYLGTLAYAVTGVRELMKHDAIWCEVTLDKERRTFYTHQLFIANGKYRGPIPVSKETSVYAETLTLGYSTSKSRWEYLKDAFGFLVGRSNKRKSLVLIPIESATIKTTPQQIIQADGELIGKTPAEVRIVKNAIRVLTRPEEQDQPRRQRKNRR